MLPSINTAPRPPSATVWRKAAPLLSALGITLFLLLPERTVFDGYDWTQLHVFYKESYRNGLLQGGLPQWNPFIALGRPYLADIEIAAFYPPNLLYLAGLGSGLVLTLWLHFTIGLTGMLRLAREIGCGEMAAWFGALAWALGATLLGRLQSGQVQVFCALCWLPWVFATAQDVLAAGNRRAAARFAACLALFFLAGSPPVFWVTGWAVALGVGLRLLLTRLPSGTGRGLGWLALGVALAAALVSVQALPFLELVAEGNRQGGDPAFALGNNQPAQVLGSLLVPRFPRGQFYWEYNLYGGLLLLPLSLLTIGRLRSPAIAGLWLIAIVFALLAAGAATPLLPALVESVPGWGSFRYPSRYGMVVGFALCLLAARGLEQLLTGLAARGSNRPAFALGVGAVLLGLNVAEACRAHWARAELYTHAPAARREEQVADELRAAGLLRPGQPPPRVLAPPWLVREDSGLRYGFTTLSGFANPALARVWQHLHRQAGLAPSPTDPVNLPLAMYGTPFVDFGEMDIAARWDPISEKFLLAPRPEPRAQLEAGASGGVVTVESYAHDRLRLRYTAPAAGHLLVAEPWYPGWEAQIDGTSARVEAASGWRRRVAVPAGTHVVELIFRSRWLIPGMIVSLAAMLVVAALWFGGRQVPRPD